MTVSEARSVLLCASDNKRLQAIVDNQLEPGDPLFDEIDNATIVPDDELPADIVTMNSEVHVRDLDTDETLVLKLVYPNELDGTTGQVSVTAPVGAALIGLKEGEEIEWPLPFNKIRRLRVVGVRRS